MIDKKEELSKKIDNNTKKIEELLNELNEFKAVIKNLDNDNNKDNYENNNHNSRNNNSNELRNYQKEIQTLEDENKKNIGKDNNNKNIINSQIKLISGLKDIINELSTQKNNSNTSLNNVSIENTKLKNEFSIIKEKNNKNSENIRQKQIVENNLKNHLETLIKKNTYDGKFIQKYTENYQNKIEEIKKNNLIEIAEKDSRIKSMEILISRFKNELFNLKSSMNDILAKEETIKKKEELFKKIIQSKENIIMRLETDLIKIKNDSTYKNEIIERLKGDIFKKDKTILKKEGELDDTINNKLKTIIGKYEANSRLLNQAYREKEEKINLLNSRHRTEIEEKNNIIINLNNAIFNLKEELNVLKKEINSITILEETIKKKEELFNEKIFLKNQVITRLETDLLRFRNLLEKKESKENELKSNLFSKDKEIMESNIKLKELTSKENLIKEDIGIISDVLKNANKKINLSEEELKLKNQAIKKLLEDMKNLEEVNKKKNTIVSELQKKNVVLDNEIISARTAIDKLKSEISKKERYVVEIENENNINKTKIESSRKAMDTFLKENISLKKVLKENTLEFSKKSIELDRKLYSDNKKHLLEIKNINEEYENRIGELIKEHMNSELNLKLRLENLMKIIDEQNKIIMEKREMEKKIAVELTTKIREALMLGSNKLKELNEFNPESILHPENSKDNITSDVKKEEIKLNKTIDLSEITPLENNEEETITKNHSKNKEIMKKEFRKNLGVDSKKTHVDSLVKMALSHKESPEKIIKTLTKSGYNINEIKTSLNKHMKKF